MSTVADLVVRELRGAGVRALFGVPGGAGNLDVIEAAGREGVPFVLTATETGGAIAALAQAEVTGQAGACVTTLGPGAASVVNGVACAFLDRAPVIVLTDSYAEGARSAFEHQRLDQGALFAPITKMSAALAPDTAEDVVRRAIGVANSGRPGPVHLECPGDVCGRALLESTSDRGVHVSGAARWAHEGDQARWHDVLARSRRPLIVVGLGARSAADAAAIRSFCEGRTIPAMVTYKAKGVMPDTHPLFAGVFTNAAIEQPLIDDSDLLIGVGLDPVELLPRPWPVRPPIVSCGPWDVQDDHVPFAARQIAGVPGALSAIGALLPASTWDIVAIQRSWSSQQQKIRIPTEGLAAHRVVEIAARRLAGRCRVTVDAGAHMFPATMLWPVSEPNGMLISNGLSTMGFALPAAIGAALVDRDRSVVALSGDGGLLMCLGELLTAVRERLRIITIVFSDASLSLIEIKQQGRGLAPAGVGLGAIAWPSIAAGFGVSAYVAADERGLEQAIESALACEGPSLIEARIDRSNYGATLRAVRG